MQYRLAVLISGSGSNLQSILDAQQAGHMDGTVALVVSDQSKAYGLVRAQKAGVPNATVRKKDYESLDAFGEALLDLLKDHHIDAIALAGYLKILPANVIEAYKDLILNIHPALLPKFGGVGFYGVRVHEAVLAAGEQESGATVHLVTEACDEGRIIAQEKVPVHADDTPEQLQKRVLEVEHRLYPKAINGYLRGVQ